MKTDEMRGACKEAVLRVIKESFKGQEVQLQRQLFKKRVASKMCMRRDRIIKHPDELSDELFDSVMQEIDETDLGWVIVHVGWHQDLKDTIDLYPYK